MIHRRSFLLTPLALAAAADRKPNVVLIIARGWRGQATPWAGDPDLIAPNLEQFARDAVVIPRAYSCYPRSTPARAAIVTGRFPHTTGVVKDGATLPASEVTIDAVLRRAGYQTSTDLGANRTLPFFLRLSLDPPRLAQVFEDRTMHPRQNVTDENAREKLIYAYGVLRALDRELQRILQAIGSAEDTIVVFTSDHGQQLGSHELDDDDVAYEESVRIPLAIRYPRVLRSGPSDLLFSQLDIMPTLLGFCGERVPDEVQGHDLSALLRGEKSERPESLYAEGRIGQKDEWRMFVLGSDKLVINAQGDVTHLFNLADDPYELTNLVHEPSTQLKRDQLAALLRTSMRKFGDFKKR